MDVEVPRACLSLALARLDQDVDDPFIYNSSRPNKLIHSSKMYSEWPKRRGGGGKVGTRCKKYDWVGLFRQI